MKTTVERVDETTVKLSVTVEAERVDAAIDAAARRLSQQVKVPGFRPGRVPRKVLESRIGKGALLQEALGDALPTFYTEAAQAESLSVVSQPEFDIDTFEDGKDAAFTATVQVLPEVAAPEFAGLQIAHPDWEVTEDDVAEQLDGMRERFAELTTVERAAEVGDHVRVTITGRSGGEPDPDASADDILYEINDPEQSQAELDRALLGAEADTTITFTDTLGADYGERAGEELEFTCEVKEVKTKELPALDDDFAVTASEFDTIDELREALTEQLARYKLDQALQELRGKVVEAVADLVEVSLPDALVQHEVTHRLNRVMSDAQQHGMELDQYLQAVGMQPDALVERFTADARDTVKAQLVLDAIGREAGIEVEQEDLAQEVYRQAARLGRDPQELAQLMTGPERIQALVADAFRRKTIDHVIEQVQILSAPSEEDIERILASAEEDTEVEDGPDGAEDTEPAAAEAAAPPADEAADTGAVASADTADDTDDEEPATGS